MLSTKLEQYGDVKTILEKVIKAGGGRFTLSSPGQAIRWRQRAYYFRTLTKRAQPGVLTPLDRMMLRIEKEDPNTVLIEFPHLTGTLTTLDGAPIAAEEKEVDQDALKRLVEQRISRL